MKLKKDKINPFVPIVAFMQRISKKINFMRRRFNGKKFFGIYESVDDKNLFKAFVQNLTEKINREQVWVK